MTAAPWAALGLGAVTSLALSLALTTLWPVGVLMRENYAGRPVPAALGLAVVAGALLGTSIADGLPATDLETALWASLLGLLVVGILDDRVRSGPRGIVGHLRSLAEGRPTTGILKLVAGVAAAIAVALTSDVSPGRLVAGVLLIATSVNLFNALDVVPGRSLKWAVVVLAPSVVATWGALPAVLVAGLGAAFAALPFDLRERGMLGDGGANPLGLLVGAAAFLALPTPWLVGAAAAALLLQLVAETVTLSRVIATTPPLRWFDLVGRP